MNSMKKLLFAVLAATCMVANAQDTFTIKASGFDRYNDQYVKLDISRVTVDSVLVKNGCFTFTGKADDTKIGHIVSFNHYYGLGSVVLEPGVVNIDPKHIGGTPANDAWQAYNDAVADYNKEVEQVQKEYGVYVDKYNALKKEGKDGLSEEDKDIVRAIMARGDSVQLLIAGVALEHSYKNLDNIVPGQIIIYHRDRIPYDDAEALFAKASDKLKAEPNFAAYMKYVEGRRRAAVGIKYTDIEMFDPEGKNVKISDYVGNGKFLYVDFWASWCVPCRMELPFVRAAYEKYGNKNLTVLGVSLDEGEKPWLRALEQLQLPWAQMCDYKGWKSKACEVYGIKAIPFTMLIDPEGNIVATGLRGETLCDDLAKYLEK